MLYKMNGITSFAEHLDLYTDRCVQLVLALMVVVLPTRSSWDSADDVILEALVLLKQYTNSWKQNMIPLSG